VEVGTVIEAGIAGVAQPEFVLAGFHQTLFTSQREVEGAGVGTGLHGVVGRGRHKSNRGSSSSPVGRSSSSHRKLVSVSVRQVSSVTKKKKYFNFIQTTRVPGRSRYNCKKFI
jgi:hypothetical protein